MTQIIKDYSLINAQNKVNAINAKFTDMLNKSDYVSILKDCSVKYQFETEDSAPKTRHQLINVLQGGKLPVMPAVIRAQANKCSAIIGRYYDVIMDEISDTSGKEKFSRKWLYTELKSLAILCGIPEENMLNERGDIRQLMVLCAKGDKDNDTLRYIGITCKNKTGVLLAIQHLLSACACGTHLSAKKSKDLSKMYDDNGYFNPDVKTEEVNK